VLSYPSCLTIVARSSRAATRRQRFFDPLVADQEPPGRDWPYSSFHRNLRAGLFPVDWGGDAETIGEFGER
jgi:hypothetical protein